MPPTALSRSRTTTDTPRSERRQAADIPAGPAPSTTTAGFFRSDSLGNDKLIKVQSKRQAPKRQRERFLDLESLPQPAAHLRRRRKRHVVGIPDRKFPQEQTARAHGHVVGDNH